jgi:hypothetical protein
MVPEPLMVTGVGNDAIFTANVRERLDPQALLVTTLMSPAVAPQA